MKHIKATPKDLSDGFSRPKPQALKPKHRFRDVHPGFDHRVAPFSLKDILSKFGKKDR